MDTGSEENEHPQKEKGATAMHPTRSKTAHRPGSNQIRTWGPSALLLHKPAAHDSQKKQPEFGADD